MYRLPFLPLAVYKGDENIEIEISKRSKNVNTKINKLCE